MGRIGPGRARSVEWDCLTAYVARAQYDPGRGWVMQRVARLFGTDQVVLQ